MTYRSLLTMLISLICSAVISQSFISTQKQWNVKATGWGGSPETGFYFISGDSTINNQNYSIIRSSYDSLSTIFIQGLMREAGDVVYFLPPDHTEGILYDFSLQAGDSAYVRNMFCGDQDMALYVLKVDTVEHYGVERKRWFLTHYGAIVDLWLEGIGSLFGPLHTAFNLCIVCPTWELLCYYEDDELLYIMPSANSCYETSVGVEEITAGSGAAISPNPVKRGQPLRINMETNAYQVRLFNAAGSLIETFYPAGKNELTISTENYRQGIYILQIITATRQTHTIKVVIE